MRQWVEEYAKARGIKNYVAGQVWYSNHFNRADAVKYSEVIICSCHSCCDGAVDGHDV